MNRLEYHKTKIKDDRQTSKSSRTFRWFMSITQVVKLLCLIIIQVSCRDNHRVRIMSYDKLKDGKDAIGHFIE